MQNIYAGSFLNISAAGAEDSSGGCFFQRSPADVTRTVIEPSWLKFPSGKYMIYPTEWFRDIDDSNLNHRAWVLQERLLSPRALHFATKQVCWECNEQMACEIFPNGLTFGGDGSPLYYHLKAYLGAGLVTLDTEEWFFTWLHILRTYTKSLLTVPSDRLVAIAGIAKQAAERGIKPSDDYLAGIWKSDLPNALLWNVLGSKHGDGKPSFRPADYRAPSWSWASVEGDISHVSSAIGRIADEYDEQTLTTTAVLGVKITGGEAFCVQPVTGGYLRIRGPFARIKWEEYCPHPQVAFWTVGFIPCLTSVVDDRGTSWPAAAFTKINSVYFDKFSPDSTHSTEYFALVVTVEPLPSGNGRSEMIQVNGLLLSQVFGSQNECYRRVGAFSLGSLYVGPEYEYPKFAALQEREICII